MGLQVTLTEQIFEYYNSDETNTYAYLTDINQSAANIIELDEYYVSLGSY